MEGSLNAIAALFDGDLDTLDWATLTYQQTAAIQACLLERYASATAKKMVCALRRVLEQAYRLKLMNVEDYECGDGYGYCSKVSRSCESDDDGEVRSSVC